MPIVRDDDPRVGCLAVPISAIAGFVVFALVAAAVGAGPTSAVVVGLLGVVTGVAAATTVLRRR